MRVFYGVFISIVLALWLYRVRSYYLYKNSGSILAVISSRNWALVIAWLIIGVLWIHTSLIRYRSGLDYDQTWFEELIFWILIISFHIFGFIQRTVFTQGGVLHNGNFWLWKDIVSWKWDKNSTLLLKVEPQIIIFRPPLKLKMKVNISQKELIEQLLTEHV